VQAVQRIPLEVERQTTQKKTIFFKKRKKTNSRRRLVRGNFTTKIA